MNIEGRICRLRALEPSDLDLLYTWENDPSVWGVSGTLSPFSRHTLETYIEAQRFDLFRSRQQRLVIETLDGRPVGLADLFEVEPLHRRAGVGILIHDPEERGRGYAREALELLIGYARRTLGLQQLWGSVETDNEASLRLFRSIGFTEIGTRRRWNWSPDGWKDETEFQYLIDQA